MNNLVKSLIAKGVSDINTENANQEQTINEDRNYLNDYEKSGMAYKLAHFIEKKLYEYEQKKSEEKRGRYRRIE